MSVGLVDVAAPRAVGYLRVSSPTQVEGYSLEYQEKIQREYAERQDWQIVALFNDPGRTGRTVNRAEFQRMLDFIKKVGNVSFLMVAKSDRLNRNDEDYYEIRKALQPLGVQVISVTEPVFQDNSPSGRYAQRLIIANNAYYSDNLAVEVRKGQQVRRERGGWPGLAPVGYVNVRRDTAERKNQALIEPGTMAPLVGAAFDLYATGHYSGAQLLDEMTARGLRNRNGSPMSLSAFMDMLGSEAYIGRIPHKGSWLAGVHEPIVSEKIFAEVQKTLKAHITGERQRTHHHYLKGALFCGCGCLMCYMLAKRQYGYYFCLHKSAGRECAEPFAPVEPLERDVEDLYFRVTVPEARKREIRREVMVAVQAKMRSLGPDRQFAEADLRRIEAEELRLARALAKDLLREEVYEIEQRRLTLERQGLEATLMTDQEITEAPKLYELAF